MKRNQKLERGKDKFNQKGDNIKFPKKLPTLLKWDAKTIRIFNEYLLTYEKLPSYKKILNSMIKFNNMYIYHPPSLLMAKRFFVNQDEIRKYLKYKRASVYMNKKDIVNTYEDVSGKKLIVTSRGHKIFYEEYPLAKLRSEKWNGEWTIIMYDFPERIRDKRVFIRNKLMSLGFGSPQISILISPLPLSEPIKKLIDGEDMAQHVLVLSSKRVLGMENREIAKKSWPIEKINHLYEVLLESLPKAKKNGKDYLDEWKRYFLAVNTADPYLPKELLPDDWVGKECEDEFVKLGFGGPLKLLFRKSFT